MMGFDPLVQLLHEIDAIAAFKLAINRDVRGTFNIVADGVLPLSTVIKLAGRISPPSRTRWPRRPSRCFGRPSSPTRRRASSSTCASCASPTARRRGTPMGFRPAYTTREALLDFTSAQRLRDVHLLHEPTA